MTPFFLITTPRSRGTLLMRMLDASPGIRCSGENTPMLESLRNLDRLPGREAKRHAGEPWPMRRQHTEAASWSSSLASTLRAWVNPPAGSTHYGTRSSFLGREGWRDAVDWWSWILETWPEARIVFLGRDQGEVELSMLSSSHLWRPHYGTCPGVCGGKVKHHLLSMADFHELNPERTTVLDAADLSDFDKTAGALAHVGISLDRQAWEAELAVVSGTRKQSSPPRKEKPTAPTLAAVLFDPKTTYEQALALTSLPVDPVEAWKLDPFGDAKQKAMVAAYVPKAPRKFLEQPALHERAIVYPWLSTAAAWGELELQHSLRSIEQHFADKECPIYILGDAAPKFLDPTGRVKFLRMDYTRSRRRGLHQAFTTGLQIAERVLWMNDDIYLLKRTGWEDFAVALTEGVLDRKAASLIKSDNSWKQWLGETVLDLKQRGVETVHRFATHTPFLFEREKSLEILRGFHLPYKGGFVTRYHAWHRTPHKPCGKLKTKTLPASGHARFLNHNNYTLTDELKQAIAARFPGPAPWERQAEAVPRIVHQVWISPDGNGIPDAVYPADWRDSWKQHHPEWEHRLWTDAELEPLVSQHAEFLPAWKAAAPVVKADLARLLVLHAHGGVYADLDYIAQKPLDPLLDGVALAVPAFADGYLVNALMAATPGHPALLATARAGLKKWKARKKRRPEESFGQENMREVLAKHSFTPWKSADVCPHDWRIDQPAAEYPDAYAVTTWAHHW